MGRPPKPWLRKGRGYCVELDGKQISLGKDKAIADQKFYELMAKRLTNKPVGGRSVVGLIAEFLEWCEINKAPATYQYYQPRLASFAASIPLTLLIDDLIPHHVTKWIDGQEGISKPTKRACLRSVKRVCGWALSEGLIKHDPLRSVRLPPQGRRNSYLTPAQQNQLLDAIGESGRSRDRDPFHDLVVCSMDTGCRPQEIKAVEARQFDREHQCWRFDPDEHKTGERTGEQRRVYLTERAAAIVERLAAQYPEGPIFRNGSGESWTTTAIGKRFRRMRKKLGFDGMVHYSLRHSCATDLLRNGATPEEVRILLGHSNLDMMKVYSHLANESRHALQVLKDRRGCGQLPADRTIDPPNTTEAAAA